MSAIEILKLEREIQLAEKELMQFIAEFAKLKKSFATLKAADLEGRRKMDQEYWDGFRKACFPQPKIDSNGRIIK